MEENQAPSDDPSHYCSSELSWSEYLIRLFLRQQERQEGRNSTGNPQSYPHFVGSRYSFRKTLFSVVFFFEEKSCCGI